MNHLTGSMMDATRLSALPPSWCWLVTLRSNEYKNINQIIKRVGYRDISILTGREYLRVIVVAKN